MTDSKHCRQCGTCCRKGGPTLGREDIDLVRQGHIRHDQLITIRQGEMGYNPATTKLEPVPVELLKIRGQGSGWTCLFLAEANNGCTIYAHRPTTCRILECRQPEALLATIYQNTLRRADLINPNDPILDEIDRHERACPGKEFTGLLAKAAGDGCLPAHRNGPRRSCHQGRGCPKNRNFAGAGVFSLWQAAVQAAGRLWDKMCRGKPGDSFGKAKKL